MRHKILSIDVENKRASCAVCGRVDIVHSGRQKNGSERWRCRTKTQEGTKKRGDRRVQVKGLTTKNIPKRLDECQICGKTMEQNGKRLALDHDHKTGIPRGYLCNNCNLGLGCFEDSTKVMKRAIRYLKKERRTD